MEELLVRCRGKKIELCFDKCDNFSEALSELQKKKSFFQGSETRITYSGIKLSYNDEMKLEKELRSLFGEKTILEKKKRLSKKQIEYSFREGEKICLVAEKSLRSGEVLESRGDLVVYGDVNPGATIKADGNITVIGALRGTAHIKRDGKVYATYMKPAQIIIGKVCSYNKNTENVGTAVAMAENGEIILQRM